MIRVAYDITLLGRLYQCELGRTGLFRYSEELLKALNTFDEICIYPCCLSADTQYWDYIISTLYLKKEFPSLIPKFLNNQESTLLRFYESIENAYISSQKKSKHIPLKVTRKLLQWINTLRTSQSDQFLKNEFDIYHSNYFPLPVTNNFNCPKIITIYDLLPVLYPNYFDRENIQRFQKILQSINIDRDSVICISESTKNDLCNHIKILPSRVFVTPLAASEKFYPSCNNDDEVLKKYGIPLNSRYFLSLCRIEKRKNLIHLINSYTQLIREIKVDDVFLVLAGPHAQDNQEIKQAIVNNQDLNKKIIFTGFISDEDINIIYTNALAFVYLSIYEGFGLPVLEAMKCGVPIISSNTSSLPEVVGDSGFMVDPNNVDDFCHAAIKIINSPCLREKLSKKSLERSKMFSWTNCASKTIEAYQRALKIY